MSEASSKAEQRGPTLSRVRRQLHRLPFLPAGSIFIFALALLAALHGAGLYLFTRGFLLTRQTISKVNDCDPIAASGNLDPSCSLPPTHSKVVFLVVDALRADFVLPVDHSRDFANHVTLPYELTQQDPTRSFLSHFIADAPTTTLQRLKGLTTGSLPTFIDMGSNFAGERVDEDNWLWQAKRAGKKIAMVGDETWLNVFPRGREGVWQDDKVWPYDSFDVEDLDTVDNGVRNHLLPLLDEPQDWDVIVAHGLGVDHAGHRFGADHPEMTRKLKETDELLREVVSKLDEETLLVVIGDHGMTDRGDHGGDTREEVDAALWVYSKAKEPLIDSTWFEHPLDSSLHPLATLYSQAKSSADLGDKFDLDWSAKTLSTHRSVSQIDIVPTLSLLLGLPVPFGNLGLPIPELFYRSSSLPVAPTPAETEKKSKRGLFGIGRPSHPELRDHETLNPLQTLLQATLITSSQLSEYLLTYTSQPSGKDLVPSMPELSFVLSIAQAAYKGAHAPGHDRHEMELRALEKFWSFERKAREKARIVWARFDRTLMGAGIVVWIGGIAVAIKMVSETKKGAGARSLLGRGIEGGLVGFATSLLLSVLGGFRQYGGVGSKSIVFTTAVATELAILASPSASSLTLARRLKNLVTPRRLVSIAPLAIHSALFASNSLTVFEDTAVLYLLSSLLVVNLVRAFAAPQARLRNRLVAFSAIALVCVRLMAWSTICREEQVPRCRPTFYLSAGSTQANVALALAGLAAFLLPTILVSSLAVSKSDEGLAPFFIGGSVRALLVAGSAYWIVDSVISTFGLNGDHAVLAVLVKTGLARIVLVGSILTATLVWRLSPLCIRVQHNKIQNSDGTAERNQIKVIGFANALGSSYLLFFSACFTLLFLVSPPPAQIVLSLHLVVILCLLEIFDSERDVQHITRALSSTNAIEAFLNNDLPPAPPHTGPNFLQLSTLALLAHVSFFSTGHQAVLSSIQWSSAFIGFPALTYPFAPVLVTLNTLSSHILTALSIPLFVFWNIPPKLADQPPLVTPRHLLRSGLLYSTYLAVVGLASAVCSAWLRRHLMVWKIFAPRFMLAGVSIVVVDIVIVFSMSWAAKGTLGKVKKSLGTRVAE
ncbi:mannose-ethanolamine phosphotransferase GPI13 [Sporobolomyces salmoneus]|uniref:mannose-ethanolamine phosphotransferase GPI13 n=1 Tax=Sporobolomyces salmoneus TaxID=183962 RepID=UPI00317BA984